MAMQIEADVQLARLLAGLHGSRARKEVSERANAVMEAGAQLLLTEDRLTATMEAAQVKLWTSFLLYTGMAVKLLKPQQINCRSCPWDNPLYCIHQTNIRESKLTHFWTYGRQPFSS